MHYSKSFFRNLWILFHGFNFVLFERQWRWLGKSYENQYQEQIAFIKFSCDTLPMLSSFFYNKLSSSYGHPSFVNSIFTIFGIGFKCKSSIIWLFNFNFIRKLSFEASSVIVNKRKNVTQSLTVWEPNI